MMKQLKYLTLFLFLLSFGCSTPAHQPFSTQLEVPVNEGPSMDTEITVDDSENSIIVDTVDGVEVAAEDPGAENEAKQNEDDCTVPGSCADGDKVTADEEKNLEAAAIENNTESSESEEDRLAAKKAKDQGYLDTALDFCDASQEFWSEGDLENAIETLDEAYSLVLKVNTVRSPELIQQKEDLRFMISKRILEIYASRYTAVNGNHNEIPLIMNEHVEKEIKNFQGHERRFFIESYQRSGQYMDMILAELKEAGLPQELAWLPLIESGFKVKALSRARALGLWQFIPSTGYKFGLKRDTWIDERLDPEKATLAAIEYMKELHQVFGDWMTVLAGYNCGEGRVLKQIRNQRINYLDNFWDLYQQLPNETARYVPRFLATLHILKDPEKYGFDLDEPQKPVLYETVEIEKQIHLKTVAEKIGVSLADLGLLNPELRHQVTPPTDYSLKVPSDRVSVFMAHVDEMPKWTPPENAYVYHRVKQGETLSLIAKKYRTSIKSIALANNIRRMHFIRVGQKLKVPLKGGSVRTVSASPEKLMPGGEYEIQKGDSLWLIAKKFHTNTKKLQRINNLQNTRLRVGQVLKVTE